MSTQNTRSPGPAVRPVNVTYLVIGLVFLGIVGVWALVTGDVVDTDQLTWLLPLTLVVAGGIGLVAIAARGMTRGRVRRASDPGADADLGDLEATAYAPYARDDERTRVLGEHQGTDSTDSTHEPETSTDPQGENR